jgi:hypothetical protein
MGFSCLADSRRARNGLCLHENSCRQFQNDLSFVVDMVAEMPSPDVAKARALVRSQNSYADRLLRALEEAAPAELAGDEGALGVASSDAAFDAVLGEYCPAREVPEFARDAGLAGRGWREDRESLLRILRQLRDATAAVLDQGLLDGSGKRERPWDAEFLVDKVLEVFLRWYGKRQNGRGSTFRKDLLTVLTYSFDKAGREIPADWSLDSSVEGIRVRGWRDYIEPALRRARARTPPGHRQDRLADDSSSDEE